MLGNVNSSGPMVGSILTNPFDVLISSIRIFQNRESKVPDPLDSSALCAGRLLRVSDDENRISYPS
jgi:hypothetical protein